VTRSQPLGSRLMADKWSHPWQLYYLIIVASLASAVQGWDNTGANGAK